MSETELVRILPNRKLPDFSKTVKCQNISKVERYQNLKMSESFKTKDFRILQNQRMSESELFRPENTGEGMNINVL